MIMRRFNAAPFFVIAALILAWHFALSGPSQDSDTLAPPLPVLRSLVMMIGNGDILVASFETLSAAVLGLCLGGFLGVLLGVAGGMSTPIAMIIRAPVELLRPLPAIALVPLMTIAFGLGLRMEVYVVAFAVFWPAVILTQTAVVNVERQLVEVADALQLDMFAKVGKIIRPAIFPRLIVMLRFNAAIALLIAVTVELVSNPRGLGNQMMLASEAFDPARMLAYLVAITTIGWIINWGLVHFEKRLMVLK
jgi:sulfonate transport system permease protein